MAMPGRTAEAAVAQTSDPQAGATAEALARRLDETLRTTPDDPPPLGDPREASVIRTWAVLADGIAEGHLDSALIGALTRLAAVPEARARLERVGLMPDVPVQAALIAGYIRMFRRIKAIAASGGLDDEAMMAETRRDMRALNARMAEALGTIRDQHARLARANRAQIDRERRQARLNLDLARAHDEVAALRSALSQAESERDEAQRALDAVRAERDAVRRDLNRSRAGIEDLKARYLEKFALALHDLNRAREALLNDPASTLPALKASVAQGYYMILEDMDAGEVARKLMASIVKDGL